MDKTAKVERLKTLCQEVQKSIVKGSKMTISYNITNNDIYIKIFDKGSKVKVHFYYSADISGKSKAAEARLDSAITDMENFLQTQSIKQ